MSALTEHGRRSRATLMDRDELVHLDVAIRQSAPTVRAPAPTVSERCACGSSITSAPDEESIELAVQTHQRQPEHIGYVAREQLAGWFVAVQPVAQLWRIQGGQRPA